MCMKILAIFFGQSGRNHVGVTDGLHLVDVIVFDPGVEQLVDGVEEAHHLRIASVQIN